tara:strand:+ start:822 stop:1013 length:192 start_codon:yes stop_codon:yes gene_type:complete
MQKKYKKKNIKIVFSCDYKLNMVDKKYPKGSITDIIIKYKIHLETGLFKGILKIFLYTTSIPT